MSETVVLRGGNNNNNNPAGNRWDNNSGNANSNYGLRISANKVLDIKEVYSFL